MERNFDPSDMEKKRELHPKADQKNFIDDRKGKLVLRCGGKKRRGGLCKSIAGAGTNHPGYGRCKFCGGSSTGPKTQEGREKVAQNSRKHGLYAKYLTDEEKSTFEDLINKKDLSLIKEISLCRTKLDSYLSHCWLIERSQGNKGLIKTRIKNGVLSQYQMGSIEDPHLLKLLEQLRRLIATANSIDVDTEETLLDKINAELRAASLQNSQASWGTRQPQQRVTENE
jgi:hypothetical protein